MSTCLQQKGTKGICPTLRCWVSVPGHGSWRCYQCKWAAALLCPRRTEPPEPKGCLEPWNQPWPRGAWSTGVSHDPEELWREGERDVLFFKLSSSCFVLSLWEENAFSVGAELTWDHQMVLIEKWHLCHEETLPALTAAEQGEATALWTWGCARSCSARPEWSAQGVEEPCGPGLALLSHLKLLKHSRAAPAAPQGSAKGANSGVEWQSEWLIQLRGRAASPQQSISIRIPPVADLKPFLIKESTWEGWLKMTEAELERNTFNSFSTEPVCCELLPVAVLQCRANPLWIVP